MKALLNKECKLCLHPAVFIYLAMVLMLLIPNYPFLVSCFFVCNALFFCFQQARENGDQMYSAMLPVSKAQTVKARVLLVVIIQAVDLVLMAALCALAIVTMPPANAGGTDHSLSLLAFALVVFAIFNLIFLTSYYKTGYKAGTAFIKASIGVWIWLILCEGTMIASHTIAENGADIAFFRFIHEAIDCMPKTPSAWTVQSILFGVALAVYACFTLIATWKSIRNYEKVDVA